MYVFSKFTGVWSRQYKLFATDAISYDSFGRHVYINSDTIMVGSVSDDNSGNDAGAISHACITAYIHV